MKEQIFIDTHFPDFYTGHEKKLQILISNLGKEEVGIFDPMWRPASKYLTLKESMPFFRAAIASGNLGTMIIRPTFWRSLKKSNESAIQQSHILDMHHPWPVHREENWDKKSGRFDPASQSCWRYRTRNILDEEIKGNEVCIDKFSSGFTDNKIFNWSIGIKPAQSVIFETRFEAQDFLWFLEPNVPLTAWQLFSLLRNLKLSINFDSFAELVDVPREFKAFLFSYYIGNKSQTGEYFLQGKFENFLLDNL